VATLGHVGGETRSSGVLAICRERGGDEPVMGGMVLGPSRRLQAREEEEGRACVARSRRWRRRRAPSSSELLGAAGEEDDKVRWAGPGGPRPVRQVSFSSFSV
jgi:hypothetical protein